MEFVYLILISFGASWLTFFSGFGLGTLLSPVFFLLFNDLQLAIAATAVVHFLNNVFKFVLMKGHVDWKIVKPFGLAAIPAAFAGALIMGSFTDFVLFEYDLGDKHFSVYLMNVVFGIVLIGFALIELIPKWSLVFAKQSLVVGGLISGFFGGLSGHQGALRTAFLIRYDLTKEVFLASGIVIAMIVDIVRTPTYFIKNGLGSIEDQWHIILISLAGAVVGAISGKLLLKKIKFTALTTFIGVAMLIFGILLSMGILNK